MNTKKVDELIKHIELLIKYINNEYLLGKVCTICSAISLVIPINEVTPLYQFLYNRKIKEDGIAHSAVWWPLHDKDSRINFLKRQIDYLKKELEDFNTIHKSVDKVIKSVISTEPINISITELRPNTLEIKIIGERYHRSPRTSIEINIDNFTPISSVLSLISFMQEFKSITSIEAIQKFDKNIL